MSPTSHRPELDLLRRQVADLARELAERDRVLHEQTRHFEVAQALAHLGSWNWNIASGEVEWSDELYRIFGYQPRARAITFDSFVSAVLPDDHDRVLASIDDALAGAAAHDMECRIVRPDGAVRTIHCCGEVVRDSGGQPLRMFGTALDITDRKPTEAMLGTSEERLRQALRASGTGLWEWNTETNDVVFSEEWKHQLGYEPVELADSFEAWMTRLHPEDRDAAMAYVQDYVSHRKGDYRQEFRLRHKDGTYRWIEARASFVTEPDGRQIYLLGSHADITDRKRMEESVRESEEWYRTLVELSPSGVFVSEEQAVYVNHMDAVRDLAERNRAQAALRASEERLRLAMDAADLGSWDVDIRTGEAVWNRRHALMQGYTPDDGPVSIHRWKDRIHPDDFDRVMVEVELAKETQELFSVEHRTVWGDGAEERWLSLYGRFFYDKTGVPVRFSGVSIDITERTRAQEALRESEARWQQFAESVGSAFWIADMTPEGKKVLYVNSAFTSIWGIEREEIYQNWFLWLDSIHPDDRARVTANHDRFVGGGATAVFHCEYRIVGRDGHVRWISDRRVRMAGWENRVAGIAEDITHHKQQLALMAQTEAIGKIGGWELDFLTNRLWWSEETYRLHETTPELYNPTVETALEFYTAERRPLLAEALEKAVTQGVSWDLELDLVSAKGRQIAVRAVGKVEVVNDRAVRAYGTFQDISERKRAEAALRRAHDELERKVIERTAELQASEDRYARATAIGKVGVWELDIVTGEYHADANLKALFGYASEELSTDPYMWLKLVHPDDQPVAMKNWELIQSGAAEACHYELRMVKKDGSRVWTDVRCHSVRDQNGRLTHLIGATVDITERKQAEQTLSESEVRFRTLVANIPGAIYRCAVDREWTMSYLSNVIESIVGYPATEFIANHTRSYASVIHPDDRQLVEETTWTSLQEHRPYVIEYRLIHANGTVRWVYEKGQGVFTPNGEVRFLDGAIFDVTERRHAGEALRESEERFSKAFRTSPHPIGITEVATGRCIEVNDACLELFGFRREEVIGNSTLILGIWPNLEERVRVIERLKAGQPVRNMEFALKVKSGAVRYLLASADLAELNGTLCIVTVANDITDRKQAEEALRRSEERFAKAFQASPHPVVISELDSGLVVDANDAACQLFAYRKEEVVGRTTQEIGLWPSTEARDRYLELLKRQGSVRNVEVALRSKSGETRQCLLSSELIELNGKQCSVTVGSDITESKRLERALRLTQFSVDQAVEAILWLDPNARIFSVNDTACQMLEYSREQLMAMTVHDIDPNFPVERWVTHWNYLKEQGALIFDAKFWSRTGLVLQTDVTVNYLQHEGKEYACMILRDVAERKRAEAELRRSHTFLRQVIDTDPDLIFAKDRDGRFTVANKAVADWYGTTVEELIGKSDSDFNANAEEVEFFRRSDLEVIYSGRDRFIPEEKITDAGGKTRWLQTVKRPIFDDQGQVHMVLGAATDITERKRMEEILVQRERDLSAALQERERISQDLHDGILQSLYAVGLGLEACKPLIRKRRDPVAEKFMAALDQAIRQLNQVMSEVRNFIAGLESQVLQGGDFSTALRTMVETMSLSSSIRCRVRIDDAAAQRLSTEQALHIINIVREGVSNALRHSRAKQITVSLRDLIRSDRLAVTDDGIGFSTRSVQGVGHGLVNMAARAQKVRGLFAIQSKPDKGTRVSLDLPKETPYAHT